MTWCVCTLCLSLPLLMKQYISFRFYHFPPHTCTKLKKKCASGKSLLYFRKKCTFHLSPCLFFTFYFGSFKLIFLTVVIKFLWIYVIRTRIWSRMISVKVHKPVYKGKGKPTNLFWITQNSLGRRRFALAAVKIWHPKRRTRTDWQCCWWQKWRRKIGPEV